MVKLIMLGQVAPGAADPQARSRRPGLIGRGPGIWRPGTGMVNQGSGAAGGGSPTPGDPVVVGAYNYMQGQGWNCAWRTAGQVFAILREGDPTVYEVNRAYLDSCDYSDMPGPMQYDLETYSQSAGICPVSEVGE